MNRTVDEDHTGDVHLEHPDIGSGITLCGWVDVPSKNTRLAVNCPACIEIVKYCKGVRLPRKRKEPADDQQ